LTIFYLGSLCDTSQKGKCYDEGGDEPSKGNPYMLDTLVKTLATNPLLLLFVVAALGYPIGRIKIAGTSLGVAAVLFTGIAISAIDPSLKLPEIIYQFGLVLFVYTIGLSNGRSFFASFKRGGLRDNIFIFSMLACVLAITIAIAKFFQLKATFAAGMFAGSLTNTPALASAREYINTVSTNAASFNEPTVGYSVAYPMGVIGMLIAIVVLQRIWKIDYTQEAQKLGDLGSVSQLLHVHTIEITQIAATSEPVVAFGLRNKCDVTFSRVRHNGSVELVTPETYLHIGDLITVVGEIPELDKITPLLGERSEVHLEMDRSEVDFRRMVISNPKIAGLRVADLQLSQKYGAIITRIRRGDVEFMVQPGTVLELGDRVRVVARRTDMKTIGSLLGDSYRAVSEIDILTFSIGIALGIVLGVIPIPIPGGVSIKLGMAGGPLIVAILLGALERTGPFVWTMPHGANLTLRQVGVILFLAGIGTNAGYAFKTTVASSTGLIIFAAGAAITFAVAFGTLIIGHKILRIPMSTLIGMLAGLQTQPAVLSFALEQSDNELPNLGYAEVYPIAMISKIIFVQILLVILLR
jgi:putative transport protein